MVSELLIVNNKAGFHMHLAGRFTAAMNSFQSSVTVRYNGREVDGKSIMSVMAACMKQGALSFMGDWLWMGEKHLDIPKPV